MQLIFDNLAATIITMTIFLMLVTVHHRNQQAQVRASGSYMLRKQQVDFVETLRRDMAGMICDEDNPAGTCPDLEEDSSDRTFTFYSRIGDDETVRKVIYKRRKVGERGGTDLYQIQRYVDRSVSSDPSDFDGGSMPTITDWSIHARGPEGEKVENPADARQVHIRFETVSPIDNGEDLEPHPWEATYRPQYLRADKTL